MATSYKLTWRAFGLALLFGLGLLILFSHVFDVHSRTLWSRDGILQLSISGAAGVLGLVFGWKVDEQLRR